ncbi:MAG TPA: HIT domain-containing protein [Vicinamibacterales bacterium]|nr:HIT domain-containing protein [Vicinamibacterales bacterium]
MDRLYTPWRLAYVTEASIVTPECIFCAALATGDRETLIIHRGRRTFVILNKFPYNNGHVMVVPVRHAGHLSELEIDELHELMELTQTAERALTATYGPHGFNMGLNLGKPAGAGVLNHLHMHVVPRWNGDTNFMAVVGETRVLPEELPETAARLRDAFARALTV